MCWIDEQRIKRGKQRGERWNSEKVARMEQCEKRWEKREPCDWQQNDRCEFLLVGILHDGRNIHLLQGAHSIDLLQL